jgi:hypothetical protein
MLVTAKFSDHHLRQAILQAVCPHCSRRTPAVPGQADDVPRRCEAGCAVFKNLSAVTGLLRDAEGDPTLVLDKAARDAVCPSCALTATAGPYCHRRTERTCPLSVHGERVRDALEPLVIGHCGAD